MIQLLILVAAIVFPFIAMPLMWRRMKRVRTKVYENAETPLHGQAWEEELSSDHGLALGRAHRPNNDLIALGAEEKQATWTLTNQ